MRWMATVGGVGHGHAWHRPKRLVNKISELLEAATAAKAEGAAKAHKKKDGAEASPPGEGSSHMNAHQKQILAALTKKRDEAATNDRRRRR